VKPGRQKGGSHLSQAVNELMCRVLHMRTQLKHRDDRGEGSDGQAHPQELCGVAQPCANFVYLEVRQVQVAEAALMEELSVPTCA
jgi:hypothetical protein